MATVPNYYYQSPWIADAGRNLAAALAPADPEKTLAAQRSKWLFERQQEMARLQDEDRAAQAAGRTSLARIASGAPPPTAGTGAGDMGFAQSLAPQTYGAPSTYDDAAYGADVSSALTGGIPLGDVMTASGQRGAKFRADKELLDDRQAAAGSLAERKLADAFQMFLGRESGLNSRAGMVDDRTRDIANQRDALARELAALKARWAAEHDDRVTARPGAGGTPLDISPSDDTAMRDSVVEMITARGMKLAPEQLELVMREYAPLYQQNRNSPIARAQALEKVFKNAKIIPRDDNLFWPDVPAHYELPDANSLGAAATSPGAGLPAQTMPGVPPASANGLPPYLQRPPAQGATVPTDSPPAELFTEGEALQFDDGSVWALVNGVPTRIDNGQ